MKENISEDQKIEKKLWQERLDKKEILTESTSNDDNIIINNKPGRSNSK